MTGPAPPHGGNSAGAAAVLLSPPPPEQSQRDVCLQSKKLSGDFIPCPIASAPHDQPGSAGHAKISGQTKQQAVAGSIGPSLSYKHGNEASQVGGCTHQLHIRVKAKRNIKCRFPPSTLCAACTIDNSARPCCTKPGLQVTKTRNQTKPKKNVCQFQHIASNPALPMSGNVPLSVPEACHACTPDTNAAVTAGICGD